MRPFCERGMAAPRLWWSEVYVVHLYICHGNFLIFVKVRKLGMGNSSPDIVVIFHDRMALSFKPLLVSDKLFDIW